MKPQNEIRLGEQQWGETLGALVGSVLAVAVIWFITSLVFSLQ